MSNNAIREVDTDRLVWFEVRVPMSVASKLQRLVNKARKKHPWGDEDD